MPGLFFCVMLLLSVVALLGATEEAQQAASTARASVDAAGMQANGDSTAPALSGDGHFVAFASRASNLVEGDSNGVSDVLVKDRQTNAVLRASVATDGTQADGASVNPAISIDGRFVAFDSAATNLVTGDTNGERDVFLHDLQSGSTTRVSVGALGAQANAASSDSSVSADGRYVAFVSEASNLVSGDSNDESDVFVRDLESGTIERASVGPGGQQAAGPSEGPSMSGDGRHVVFASLARNLVPGDTNGAWDVFIRDRSDGTTILASVDSGGVQGNGQSWTPAISADGRFVAFASRATNLVAGDTNGRADVFARDLQSGVTRRVSIGPGGAQADDFSAHPAISGNGGWVAFYSHATNLVSGDTNAAQDVFVHELMSTATTRISISALGGQGGGVSLWPSISADGRFVAFPDDSSNVVPGDTNDALDVFVRGPLL